LEKNLSFSVQVKKNSWTLPN